jgi:lipopolysaccharide assembly protein A
MSTEPQPATQAAQPDAPPPQPDTTTTPPPQQQAGPPPPHTIKHTRISGLWIAVGIFALVLLFLLIFILQNSRGVDISYLGAHGHMPLGVALLLAAVCGALLAILAAAARMAQLHSTARKHRRADARR